MEVRLFPFFVILLSPWLFIHLESLFTGHKQRDPPFCSNDVWLSLSIILLHTKKKPNAERGPGLCGEGIMSAIVLSVML